VSTRRVISVDHYDKCLLLTLLVVEDDIQEGAMNLQAAVVVNEAQLPKLVHEETLDRVVPIISARVS
jgi:flagellar assembly factor FliW